MVTAATAVISLTLALQRPCVSPAGVHLRLPASGPYLKSVADFVGCLDTDGECARGTDPVSTKQGQVHRRLTEVLAPKTGILISRKGADKLQR